MDRIADNLEQTLKDFGINIYIHTSALKEKAKKSTEFENFKNIRNSTISALHDAIAIIYVKEKEQKKYVTLKK
ncbi:hypothetical protein JJC04_15445 [Flavobacterium covae]|nr:hypothetical protein [Flavobacterium covae]QYS91149.1 hypothetical protein JJC04_15445 [Flavobacterium covae]